MKTPPLITKKNVLLGFNFVDELDLKSKKQQQKGQQQQQILSSQLSLLGKDADDNSNKLSILRKPVLQLASPFGLFGTQERDANAIKNPFSLQLNSSPNPSTTSIFTKSLVSDSDKPLICHVCNSITTRKQPRKYGAICCELCKKFMSKMIERVNKQPVQQWLCDKSDGEQLLHLILECD